MLMQHRLTSLLLPHVPAAFLHRVHRSAAHLLERKDLVGWHGAHMLTTLDVFRLPYSMFYDIDCMGGWQLSALFAPPEVKLCVMKHAIQNIWP